MVTKVPVDDCGGVAESGGHWDWFGYGIEPHRVLCMFDIISGLDYSMKPQMRRIHEMFRALIE